MPNNEERAEWAQASLDVYTKLTGLTKEDGLQTAIVDLIGDLRHLADSKGIDWDEVKARANDHYSAETEWSCPHCKAKGAMEDYEYDEKQWAICYGCRKAFDLDKAEVKS